MRTTPTPTGPPQISSPRIIRNQRRIFHAMLGGRHAQIPLPRRTSRRNAAASRTRYARRRHYMKAQHLRSNVLRLEETLVHSERARFANCDRFAKRHARLKQVVADLTLDWQVLQNLLKKSGEQGAPCRRAPVRTKSVATQRTTSLCYILTSSRHAVLKIGKARSHGPANED